MTGSPDPSGPDRVTQLVGVYHANGGLLGELAYALGRLTGHGHCALCQLTHRGRRESPAWSAFRAGLAVPVCLVHLSERDAAVRAASDGRTPCVLARVSGKYLILLEPGDLEACGGDVGRFSAALREALAGRRLGLDEMTPRGMV